MIGWFQGRLEIGPRALGNRSILALPNEHAVRDRVNRLKGRELWRPLSPSILARQPLTSLAVLHAPLHICSGSLVTEYAKNLMPAVIHVDGTVRPQTVTPLINERYWQLLRSVYAKTGLPGLLNTSFNLADEPIVCSPKDALRSFFSSELDMLIIGSLVISKPAIKSRI